MMRSNRGAARVSVVWIIATVVVALVAIAFAVIASQGQTVAEQQAAAAATKENDAKALFDEEAEFARQLSRTLGFYDRTAASPRSNAETARQGFEELRAAFPALDSSIQDFEHAIPVLRREYEARGQMIAELQSRVKQLESELATERQGRQADVRSKDSLIADLRSQLADEQRNAQDREAELQGRLTSVTQQVSSLDLDVRRLEQEMSGVRRAHSLEISALQAKLQEQGSKLGFLSPEQRDQPDGKVLAVSPLTGSAWIDVGSDQRVSRGMRFRIESPGDRNRRVKAFGEVVEVQSNRSRVSIFDVADTFDPVAAGDVIVNPLYDARGERNAVLVGRFSGQFDEPRLRQLLGRIGVNVQSQLDRSTDFLIVGSEIFTDEFGEPLEEPLQPSDLPVYKEAEATGVQIIPIQRIREFFTM